MPNKEPKSNCCNAEIKETCGEDFGTEDDISTCYWECQKCKKPCDPKGLDHECEEDIYGNCYCCRRDMLGDSKSEEKKLSKCCKQPIYVFGEDWVPGICNGCSKAMPPWNARICKVINCKATTKCECQKNTQNTIPQPESEGVEGCKHEQGAWGSHQGKAFLICRKCKRKYGLNQEQLGVEVSETLHSNPTNLNKENILENFNKFWQKRIDKLHPEAKKDLDKWVDIIDDLLAAQAEQIRREERLKYTAIVMERIKAMDVLIEKYKLESDEAAKMQLLITLKEIKNS